MRDYRERLYILFLFITSLLLVLLGRVVYLTFYHGQNSISKVKYRIQRGIIYDRRGIELALSQDSSTVGIEPGNVYDSAFTSSQLAPLLNIPESKIQEQINSRSGYFLLKREIGNKLAKKIESMALPGVRIEKEFKRIYPQGTLASNLIGFAGMDDDNAISGLESQFQEEMLSSADNDTLRGNNIHLTIDSLVQHRLEVALGKAFIESGSKKAIGIFMNVHDGSILAMASFPNFNPNEYSKYMPEDRTNWAVRHVYEPGSTMKIFMAMILLNENLVKPHEKFYCPGHVEVGGNIVKCGDKHGEVDLEEILEVSCNVGIIKASQRIPREVLYDYLRRFKFGQKTGLIPSENRGYFPEQKHWNNSTASFMAIGQGISVTPIQLVTSAATVINGGKILTPRMVAYVSDSYGEIIHKTDAVFEMAGIRENTTKSVLSAMTKVVKEGTGKNAYLKDYSIAGKTGTGQKARPGEGYVKGLWSASFLGFFPADNPKIVGLILFDEPQGNVYSGGGIAAPVFRDTVEHIVPIIEKSDAASLYTLKKLPDSKIRVSDSKFPDFSGLSVKESIGIMSKYNLEYKIRGSGYCYKQEPEAGTKITSDMEVILHFK